MNKKAMERGKGNGETDGGKRMERNVTNKGVGWKGRRGRKERREEKKVHHTLCEWNLKTSFPNFSLPHSLPLSIM